MKLEKVTIISCHFIISGILFLLVNTLQEFAFKILVYLLISCKQLLELDITILNFTKSKIGVSCQISNSWRWKPDKLADLFFMWMFCPTRPLHWLGRFITLVWPVTEILSILNTKIHNLNTNICNLQICLLNLCFYSEDLFLPSCFSLTPVQFDSF